MATIKITFSIQCFSCNDSDVGGWVGVGREGGYGRRSIWGGFGARSVQGYLLGFHKVALVNDDKIFITLVKVG